MKEDMLRESHGELRTAFSFLRGLPTFLRGGTDSPGTHQLLRTRLIGREQSFADLLTRAVFANARSPYRKLFEWAGCTAGDVSTLLREVGLDATLGVLHENGIYLSLAEFKGLEPIRRSGLEIPSRLQDFDNPLPRRKYEALTGGSGGSARRVNIDLGLLEHESSYHSCFFEAESASDSPLAVWHPAPPGAVAMKSALIHARLGRRVDRWFSQREPASMLRRHSLFTDATILTARICGTHIARPEYTPAADAGRVAQWLAERVGTGSPATLITTPSACVRTCKAAIHASLDISGTLFVLVGEPYTVSKAAVVNAAGCRSRSHYAMVESGMIGLACGAPVNPDDVHLVSDKIATTQRQLLINDGISVGALFHTTLLTASPKVMINVESGDYGIIETRDCGCGMLPTDFDRHLHTIRSYEKLTSEGMCFMGGDLFHLLEHVLPERFSGHPTDYQFVEREVGGLPKVSLLVSHAVGTLDEAGVVHTVLEFLRGRGIAQSMMADVWAQGGTLDIVRGDPHVTAGGKIQPLQIFAT